MRYYCCCTYHTRIYTSRHHGFLFDRISRAEIIHSAYTAVGVVVSLMNLVYIYDLIMWRPPCEQLNYARKPFSTRVHLYTPFDRKNHHFFINPTPYRTTNNQKKTPPPRQTWVFTSLHIPVPLSPSKPASCTAVHVHPDYVPLLKPQTTSFNLTLNTLLRMNIYIIHIIDADE